MKELRKLALRNLIALTVAGILLTTTATMSAAATPTNPSNDSAGAVYTYGGEGHTFDAGTSGPSGSLVQAWTQNLGGSVSNPLVIGSTIAAIVHISNADGVRDDLEAFDAATGTPLWPPLAVGSGASDIASDGHQLYVSTAGQIDAIDLASGRQMWSTTVTGEATGGTVMLHDGLIWTGTTLQGLDPVTGAVVRTYPTVTTSGELAEVNGTIYWERCALDLNTGTTTWIATGYSGCNPETSLSQSDGRVVVQEDPSIGGVLSAVDAATGRTLYHVPTGQAALGSGQLTVAALDTLSSYDETTATQRWSIPLPADPAAPPVLFNGTANLVTIDGHLRQYDLNTGALISDSALPAAAVLPEHGVMHAPAVGSGLLAVPAMNTLTVYRGSNGTLPPSISSATPAAPQLSAAAAGTDASSGDQYGQDAGHDGVATGSTLSADLHLSWSATLPGDTSNAIVDEQGRVFVTAEDPAGGVDIYRFNRQTGAIDWGPKHLDGPGNPRLAENDGVLLDYQPGVNSSAVLHGLDPASGTLLWTTQLAAAPGYYYDGFPAVAAGTGYIHCYCGSGGGLGLAIDLQTGHLKWAGSNTSESTLLSPAIGPTLAYYSGVYDQLFAFKLTDGTLAIRSTATYDGGGPTSTILAGGLLYLNYYSGSGKILNASTGQVVDNSYFTRRPAIDVKNDISVSMQGDRLTAEKLGDRTRYWSFAGHGALTVSPVIANNLVFTADADGTLWALDEATGQPLWQDRAFSAAPVSLDADEPAQLTVGPGALAVTAGTTIRLYSSTSDAGPSDPPTPKPVITPPASPTPPVVTKPPTKPTVPPVTPKPADPITAHYAALGVGNVALGPRVGGEYLVRGGRAQNYRNGEIVYSPATGAWAVLGAIYGRYKTAGGPTSALGFPRSDEIRTFNNTGRAQQFQGAIIYWSKTTGAHTIAGPIRTRWVSLGAEHGRLGYPTTNVLAIAGGQISAFQHGIIIYSARKRTLLVIYHS